MVPGDVFQVSKNFAITPLAYSQTQSVTFGGFNVSFRRIASDEQSKEGLRKVLHEVSQDDLPYDHAVYFHEQGEYTDTNPAIIFLDDEYHPVHIIEMESYGLGRHREYFEHKLEHFSKLLRAGGYEPENIHIENISILCGIETNASPERINIFVNPRAVVNSPDAAMLGYQNNVDRYVAEITRELQSTKYDSSVTDRRIWAGTLIAWLNGTEVPTRPLEVDGLKEMPAPILKSKNNLEIRKKGLLELLKNMIEIDIIKDRRDTLIALSLLAKQGILTSDSKQAILSVLDIIKRNSNFQKAVSGIQDVESALDSAMRGGIDLSQQDAAMHVTKDANGGVKVDVDPALIARVERYGLSEVDPVIIGMRPADIQAIFGVKLLVSAG